MQGALNREKRKSRKYRVGCLCVEAMMLGAAFGGRGPVITIKSFCPMIGLGVLQGRKSG